MNIMAAMHIQDILYNDLSPNNIFLHFPINDDNAVNNGICDWSLTTWTREEAPSFYGKPNNTLLEEAKKEYN
jgi:hypothetical protein